MMNADKTRVVGGTACLLAALIFGLSAMPAAAQYGPLLSGTGPINRSMGGAATGAPLSASGALFWNPASLSGLDRSELDVGAELLIPHTNLSSSLPANSFGLGIPAVDLAGSTNNDNAVFALPTIALSYRPEESPFTYGLGIFAVAGFGLNYPGSALPGNPILSSQPPFGFGLGPIFSQYQVLQIAPALVYEVNEQLSVSISPLVDLGMVQLDPAVYANPNANGTYPSGTHSSTAWGAGYSLGAFYKAGNWNHGVSYKSKQWFQSYNFNADFAGVPRTFQLGLDLPSITSVGTSYKGFDRWLLAADLRYIDFSNTGGFGDSGFSPTGALNGVGMDSIFVVALGTQYQLTDALSLRTGYSWNQNPISNSQSSANAATPLIIQNMISFGASYQLSDSFLVSLAYMHGFENSISGPFVTPFGSVPGSSVTSTTSVDSLLLGATVKFGCPRCKVPCTTCN